MEEVNGEESCGVEKLAIRAEDVRRVSVFDRSPFDGVGRANFGREPYGYCNGDRNSGNRNN